MQVCLCFAIVNETDVFYRHAFVFQTLGFTMRVKFCVIVISYLIYYLSQIQEKLLPKLQEILLN
ncbi:protein of unknown function [Xenorhabdus poinarii G6]|uniref:Uncharacterized protein n=1 Tax=Xenorhabdus poinarii G6 TaxID=1354304 RepID=A0A068R579_9GAMM|nr:protein of unknown function [Xenorhabdus poinarii G6]